MAKDTQAQPVKLYTANVVSILENGDAVLQLPDDLLADMKWSEGDVLDFSIENGNIIMKKIEHEHDLEEITTKQDVHSIKNYPFSRDGKAFACKKCHKVWLKAKEAQKEKCIPKD